MKTSVHDRKEAEVGTNMGLDAYKIIKATLSQQKLDAIYYRKCNE
jgi:hypothetical protein